MGLIILIREIVTYGVLIPLGCSKVLEIILKFFDRDILFGKCYYFILSIISLLAGLYYSNFYSNPLELKLIFIFGCFIINFSFSMGWQWYKKNKNKKTHD